MSSDADDSYDAEFDVGKLYIWGVSLLIGFVGYTSQIFVFWSYLGGFTPRTFIVLGVFNVLLHLLYYNYYLAVTVPPGYVPIGWEPPRNGANVYELKRDTLKPRFCRACKGFKPPRTHHCSDCDKCVLKMDHHCPWTNNCVGFNNQGHFLRFVYMVDVTCTMAAALHGLRLYELVVDAVNGTYYVRQPTQIEVVFLIIDLSASLLVLLFVGILSGYHLYLVGNNTTTIESREKDRVVRLIKSKKCKPTPYPYDLGIVRNFKSVFGESVLLWWVPKQPTGTGLDFDIKDGLTPPVYWPPPGYSREVGDPAKVEQRCDPSKTIFEAQDGTRVVTEVDDDGELVIVQYSATDDPAILECGGEEGTSKNQGVLSKFFDSGKEDEKSEAGEGNWDSDGEDYDSDDDDLTDLHAPLLRKTPTSIASGVNIPGPSTAATMQRRNVFASNHHIGEYAGKLTDYTREPSVASNGGSVSKAGASDDDDDDDNTPLMRVMSRRNTLKTQ
ncbi:Palmitoyltransferase [Coemansia sp. S100]|nr:Palmitoyltransferase [Coemansia sp. S17]KAJ2097394.1 Palmitoyltransferase [Coemansia sp. S100]